MKKHSLTKALKKDLLAIAAALPPVDAHPISNRAYRDGAAILSEKPNATLKDGSPINPKEKYYLVTVASANHFRRLCKAYELGGINSVNAYVEPFRPKPVAA